ncbi:AMP-binding protein [Actinocrispum wychmicini]|uniref:Acyl-CoA synthetase (AMP-forming)/AMP-acid ligase II n=1 Tax=Actinocrispum wychmicini TaxID=1213861 RepID=A0A4R2JPL0_9PSEU|nr:AMP-binding protein [Actinocrispum wychmicini]TCO56105.1 acyl-CoA synthetase (AMP-forming)/AMP-acid ligase II [Actinocrispum wychmicini]
MALAGLERETDSLVQVFVERSQSDPDRTAYEFLHADGEVAELTYGTLFARASAVAARLVDRGDPGVALLLYPPGLGFVTALWGCLLAGVPAAPAYPPVATENDRGTARFLRIVEDAQPGVIVADPMVDGVLSTLGQQHSLPPVISVDAELESLDAAPHLPGSDDVALVQYTSGSTTEPKGVVLRHGNLVHNTRAIAEVFGLDAGSRSISWLPPYHDMGLIGCVLTPLRVGFPMRLMSPLHFLKSPLTWLRQVSDLGVTATGGPNFAYDLCVRRAQRVDLSDVDLSSWRVAFNGAEPVRRKTLEAFARQFAENGFRPEAFLPCYGLAEATLIVSGRHWHPDDSGPRVSCGPSVTGMQVAIVDDGVRVPAGTQGEIWLRGPSVTAGYLNGTDDLFGDLDGERFLRTGDLGLVRDGELFVTGRSKDVLVSQGVNYHAADIEAAAVLDNPAVQTTAAAFQADDRIVLVAARAPGTQDDDATVAGRLRTRVLEGTGARLDVVVFCPVRSIPRTTSGKVRRARCRELLVAGELPGAVAALGSWDNEFLAKFVAGVFAGVCEVPSCGVDQRLVEVGGDSIRAAEIAAALEDAVALPVPMEVVLDQATPRRVAAHLTTRWAEEGVGIRTVMGRLAGEEISQ